MFAGHPPIPEEKPNAIPKEGWVTNSPDPVPELAEDFRVSANFIRERPKFEELIRENKHEYQTRWQNRWTERFKKGKILI